MTFEVSQDMAFLFMSIYTHIYIMRTDLKHVSYKIKTRGKFENFHEKTLVCTTGILAVVF